MEYQSLIQAVPRQWKEIITNDNSSIHFLKFIESTLRINNLTKRLEDIPTKDIYWELIN